MTEISAILAGLFLLTGFLGVIPALREHLEKNTKSIGGFQFFTGLIAIIVGVPGYDDLTGLLLILSGLALSIGISLDLEWFEENFEKNARRLGSFQITIGTITLAVGLYDYLFVHPVY